jgi:hypothetical protein
MRRRPTNAEIGGPLLRRRDDGSYIPDPSQRTIDDYTGTRTGGDGEIGLRLKPRNGGGRKPGVLNKTTRIMKEAAVWAAENSVHSDGSLAGYLKYLADTHPKTFARSILAKLIPLDLRLRADVQLETPDEIREQLRARGVPIDRLFERPTLPEQPLLQRRDPDPPRAEPAPLRLVNSEEADT